MQKRHLYSGLQPLLWGAVLLALIATALAVLRPEPPTAYADAVYVWTEGAPRG